MMYRSMVCGCLWLAAAGVWPAAVPEVLAQPQQQMGDFSLSGFGEKGKKNWDLAGKQADIAADVVKLNDVQSNFYGDEETVRLTAERGDFDRKGGSIRLEDNVVITTSSGATLTTSRLDWDRKEQTVSTKEPVAIRKDDITIDGTGAHARQDLNRLNLEKDVAVRIPDAPGDVDRPGKRPAIVITCDGPLQIDSAANTALFEKNVKVTTPDSTIESDVLEVHFTARRDPTDARLSAQFAGSKIEKIVARSNVRITKDGNCSYSDEAVYTMQDRKITLSGRPKLVIVETQGPDNAPFGN